MIGIYARHGIKCYWPEDEPTASRLDEMRAKFGVQRKEEPEPEPSLQDRLTQAKARCRR